MKRLFLSACCLVAACCALCAQEATGRVQAVIVSGGMNKLMNHERYFNDCAFLYRTLREDCGLAKDDITLLMSDGGAPGLDMLPAGGTAFASSPDDLDADGERDVWLPATLEQLEATLTQLAERLTANDRLLLFVVDHGGTDDGQSFAWMWGSQRLYAEQLAALLDAFHVASMAVAMELCYSGGFIDDLRGDGRVVVTSCAEGELSWACRDRPYDEFIYHFTCAMAGHDTEGNAVAADTDADGSVSVAEAFDYARQHDRREETPQYCSVPESLGQQWTLTQKRGNGIKTMKAERDNCPDTDCYDLLGRRVSPTTAAPGRLPYRKPVILVSPQGQRVTATATLNIKK